MQAHAVVLAIHKERSSVVARFKSQKVRSAAAVALPTTTGARAAAAAAERDPIFSASDLRKWLLRGGNSSATGRSGGGCCHPDGEGG